MFCISLQPLVLVAIFFYMFRGLRLIPNKATGLLPHILVYKQQLILPFQEELAVPSLKQLENLQYSKVELLEIVRVDISKQVRQSIDKRYTMMIKQYQDKHERGGTDMIYAFAVGDLVIIKASQNSKMAVTCYLPWQFVWYVTQSYLLAEVLQSDRTTIELRVSWLRPYLSTRSQRLDRFSLLADTRNEIVESLDSFSVSVSLSSSVGENNAAVSSPADVQQGIGMAEPLHRPTKTV